jgi:hypothetical protein
MARSRRARPSSKSVRGQPAFPVPYSERVKYLKLADDFLASDRHQSEKVIPIDRGRLFRKLKAKKAGSANADRSRVREG